MIAQNNHDFPEIVFSDRFIALRRQIKLPFFDELKQDQLRNPLKSILEHLKSGPLLEK